MKNNFEISHSVLEELHKLLDTECTKEWFIEKVREKEIKDKKEWRAEKKRLIRQIHLEKLLEICIRLDDNYIRAVERSNQLSRMAQLARAGQKDTEEFKRLERLHKNPTVTDSSNEYVELHKLMKKLRK